jgi:hypothetical protein
VTRSGELSVLIEFFGRTDLLEQLQRQEFYRPKSPNRNQRGQILVSFIARSPTFCSCQPVAGRPGLTHLAWIEALSERRKCRIDELENDLAADHFCLRSFFATESAFLAVVFSFNLLSEFQRAVGPALKSDNKPPALRFEVFICGATARRVRVRYESSVKKMLRHATWTGASVVS